MNLNEQSEQSESSDPPLHPNRLAIILNPTQYVFAPSTTLPPLKSIFFGQAAVLITVILTDVFTGFRFTPEPGLVLVGDATSFLTALAFAFPVLAAGYFYDKLPFQTDFIKKANRSTRVFALRLLGPSVSTTTAVFTALVISVCAGFTVFFTVLLHIA
jgi:hypothetical protein